MNATTTPESGDTAEISYDDDLLVPAVQRLVAAVDQLGDLSAQPVDGHASRFRAVHIVLQDALSDTDGNGPQPV